MRRRASLADGVLAAGGAATEDGGWMSGRGWRVAGVAAMGGVPAGGATEAGWARTTADGRGELRPAGARGRRASAGRALAGSRPDAGGSHGGWGRRLDAEVVQASRGWERRREAEHQQPRGTTRLAAVARLASLAPHPALWLWRCSFPSGQRKAPLRSSLWCSWVLTADGPWPGRTPYGLQGMGNLVWTRGGRSPVWPPLASVRASQCSGGEGWWRGKGLYIFGLNLSCQRSFKYMDIF
jgi:hypothetical protein